MEETGGGSRELVIQLVYLVSSVMFILGLRSLTRPDQARRGMQLAAVGMLLAITGTLLHQEILTYTWIIGGMVVGIVGLARRAVVVAPVDLDHQRPPAGHADDRVGPQSPLLAADRNLGLEIGMLG